MLAVAWDRDSGGYTLNAVPRLVGPCPYGSEDMTERERWEWYYPIRLADDTQGRRLIWSFYGGRWFFNKNGPIKNSEFPYRPPNTKELW